MQTYLRTTLTIMLATATLISWGCSSSTTSPEPEPDLIILETDTTSGQTGIDIENLRLRLGMLVTGTKVPYAVIFHLLEVEEAGSEAIHHVLEKYSDGIQVLQDIHDEEKEQLLAMQVILDVLDTTDVHPEVNIGDFLDDEVNEVWDDMSNPEHHTSKLESIIAVTHVFEFQLKEAIEARELASTRAEEFIFGMIYAMNKNHWLSLYKYLKSQGVTYTPKYLSPDEFNQESQSIYVILV